MDISSPSAQGVRSEGITAFLDALERERERDRRELVIHLAGAGERVVRAGYVVEQGDTIGIFTNPQHQMTEDYVSGRFG